MIINIKYSCENKMKLLPYLRFKWLDINVMIKANNSKYTKDGR